MSGRDVRSEPPRALEARRVRPDELAVEARASHAKRLTLEADRAGTRRASTGTLDASGTGHTARAAADVRALG